ncbi:MAG: archaellin/type IV pilin N-terminal domain-containing protein [Candidatus Woesearchaeota archaeon]
MRSKSRKCFNKRGVSPLIATILLISFAVALGTVVLNWGRNLEISKPGDKCAGVSIKIRSIDSTEACYSILGQKAYIHFIMDNSGNTNIDGLSIWIIGEKGTSLQDLNDISIKKGELLNIDDQSIMYDLINYGVIEHIQFIPKIKIDNLIDTCVKSSVKAKKIGICSN